MSDSVYFFEPDQYDQYMWNLYNEYDGQTMLVSSLHIDFLVEILEKSGVEIGDPADIEQIELTSISVLLDINPQDRD